MKWLDLTLAAFAPKFAVRQLQARRAIYGYYEAAKSSRLHKSRGGSGNPDESTRLAADKLRDQARHLEENYDIAKGVLDVLVDNVVGTGIIPEPMAQTPDGKLHKDFNSELLSLWKDWIRKPEVTHELDYYSAQRLAARSWFRDGELFIQHLRGNVRGLDHGTQVPYSIELIEGDYVPSQLEEPNRGIIQGVQKNAWGRPRSYYVYLNHPDNNTFVLSSQTKRISADNMIHLKTMTRVKQTRGVSIFSCVMNRFDDIKEIEESERVAARVAAAMTGFIKKGSPDMYVAPNTGKDDDDFREMEFNPGMIYDELSVGEEVGTIASNRPNNEVITFRDGMLRAAASGVGTGASSISKNYDGSYSSQRQELVESYVHYGILWSFLVYKQAMPVWEEFVKMAVVSKKIDVPTDLDIDTLYDADYSRPAMPWIDPMKEMKGVQMELESRIASKSQVIRRRGGNPDEVRKQIVEEQERDIEDGLVPDPTKLEEPDDDLDPEDDADAPKPNKDDE
jgi:lambda family phage portal protein